MPRDYASSSSRNGTKKRARKQPRKKPAKQNRRNAPATFFHGPSVLLGAMLGAGGLGLILWAPDWLAQPVLTTEKTATEAASPVEYDYRDILEEAEVEGGQPQQSAPAITAKPTRIQLQAGAFRNPADADRLRASLLLLDLPVSNVVASLSDGDWHRVMVGPFTTRVDAQRAMTRLREQNLTPIWLESSTD